jgi:hypothetical protein
MRHSATNEAVSPAASGDADDKQDSTDLSDGKPLMVLVEPLPPRIVVEQPDGDILLGEDADRLEPERCQTAANMEEVHRQSALPGTERFLELRRLLYATALENLVVTRRRHASVVLSAQSMLPPHVPPPSVQIHLSMLHATCRRFLSWVGIQPGC